MPYKVKTEMCITSRRYRRIQKANGRPGRRDFIGSPYGELTRKGAHLNLVIIFTIKSSKLTKQFAIPTRNS